MKLVHAIAVASLLLALAGCASTPDDTGIVDPDKTAAEFYREAKRALDNGNYQTAIERLETLQARYPFGAEAKQAELDIIYAYYGAEEWDSAVSAADRFIRLNPTHERVDYALYMRASAGMNRGTDLLGRVFKTDRALRDPQPLRQAFADFKRLVTDYPASPYAEDARYRMLVLRNQLAKHELAVAEYYLSRSAYVAAANRAKSVVENYQETPAVMRALEILAEAYGKLNLPDLQQDIVRVIALNYPDHPLAKKAAAQ
jgi:outer membrane assembly lipoprotein YfiO